MRTRIRRVIAGPAAAPPPATPDGHALDAIRAELAAARGDIAALQTRLEQTDDALRFMLGEVTQVVQQVLGLALATHHFAATADRVLAPLPADVVALEERLVRLLESHLDATFASNESTAQQVRSVLERLSRAAAEPAERTLAR